MELEKEVHALADLVAEGMLMLSVGVMNALKEAVRAQEADVPTMPENIIRPALLKAAVEACLDVLPRVGEQHPQSQTLARVGSAWVLELATIQKLESDLENEATRAAAQEALDQRNQANAHRFVEWLDGRRASPLADSDEATR